MIQQRTPSYRAIGRGERKEGDGGKEGENEEMKSGNKAGHAKGRWVELSMRIMVRVSKDTRREREGIRGRRGK